MTASTDEQLKLQQLVRAIEAETAGAVDEAPLPSWWASLPSRYRPLERLGSGGEADALVALDQLLDRRVAIKVLRRNPFESGSGMPGLREARILARLEHPAIVAVYDVLFVPERTYLVMPFVHGCSLGQVIDYLRDRGIPRSARLIDDFVDTVLRLCEAVSHAHEVGALHLDIKPDNVMVGRHGQVYLLDWGSSHGIKYRGIRPDMLGTPGYMPSEQWSLPPEDLDERVDVFGIGALLFALLEGRPPPPFLDQWRATPASDAFEPLLRDALAPEPEARTATVQELHKRLLKVRQGTSRLNLKHFQAGEPIIAEGALFIIESGRCEVVLTRSGQERRLRVLGAGDTWGELALLADVGGALSARALEPTTVRVIAHSLVEEEIRKCKTWVWSMMDNLGRWTLEALLEPDE